jgi:hypothetical protein
MCNYTSAGPAQTQLAAAYCGATGASMTERIYADAVSGATAYKWRFRSGGIDHTFTGIGRSVRPSDLGLPPNTTFDAFVSYRDGSYSWQPEGPMCNYTTGAGGLKNGALTSYFGSSNNFDADPPDLNATVYPNPAEDNINVSWESHQEIIITLVDLSGRIIYQKLLSNQQNTAIDLSEQSSGIYILRVASNDKSQTIKVAKK